jgi:NMD protein affecting ribosome stability and mRNA decay
MTSHKEGSAPKGKDYLHQERHDRLLRELEHDPYHSKLKIHDPSACTECGAVYHKGRWQWGAAPGETNDTVCPACLRIRDRVPAAFLTLRGDFVTEHKEEIMHLIHNLEEREKAEHPLKRIMAVEEQGEDTVVTFTDAHLARTAGDALHHAYQGELDYQYTKEDIMLRVTWER